jgi:hypothetical protein
VLDRRVEVAGPQLDDAHLREDEAADAAEDLRVVEDGIAREQLARRAQCPLGVAAQAALVEPDGDHARGERHAAVGGDKP